MVKLHMGIWAGIAAGGVMVLLVALPILGFMFSRSKKANKAAEMEESAAEKGVVQAAPAPTSLANMTLQKPTVKISQHEIGGVRSQPSKTSMTPSSQAATLLPLRNSTPSPPHMQPMWTKP